MSVDTAGFTHRRLATGEVTLHVAEARPEGPREPPLVVLLHGFPSHWSCWTAQMRALERAGYWAVAPDLRGYGESDKPRGVAAYEVEKLAADVAGLVRALGRDRAIVVGHDWGGMVAWQFAQQHQEMLERLVAVNIPHPAAMVRGLRTGAQLLRSWYMFFFQLPAIPELALRAGNFGAARRVLAADGLDDRAIDAYLGALRDPDALAGALGYYRAALRRAATGKTPPHRVIEREVLVIWGDRDRYLGAELAEPPPRWVPNARVTHLPDSSHWPQVDAPDAVNARLLEFFARERR